jgi:hypothetical protein
LVENDKDPEWPYVLLYDFGNARFISDEKGHVSFRLSFRSELLILAHSAAHYYCVPRHL